DRGRLDRRGAVIGTSCGEEARCDAERTGHAEHGSEEGRAAIALVRFTAEAHSTPPFSSFVGSKRSAMALPPTHTSFGPAAQSEKKGSFTGYPVRLIAVVDHLEPFQ